MPTVLPTREDLNALLARRIASSRQAPTASELMWSGTAERQLGRLLYTHDAFHAALVTWRARWGPTKRLLDHVIDLTNPHGPPPGFEPRPESFPALVEALERPLSPTPVVVMAGIGWSCPDWLDGRLTGMGYGILIAASYTSPLEVTEQLTRSAPRPTFTPEPDETPEDFLKRVHHAIDPLIPLRQPGQLPVPGKEGETLRKHVTRWYAHHLLGYPYRRMAREQKTDIKAIKYSVTVAARWLPGLLPLRSTR